MKIRGELVKVILGTNYPNINQNVTNLAKGVQLAKSQSLAITT